jgi:hypothetical protein
MKQSLHSTPLFVNVLIAPKEQAQSTYPLLPLTSLSPQYRHHSSIDNAIESGLALQLEPHDLSAVSTRIEWALIALLHGEMN